MEMNAIKTLAANPPPKSRSYRAAAARAELKFQSIGAANARIAELEQALGLDHRPPSFNIIRANSVIDELENQLAAAAVLKFKSIGSASARIAELEKALGLDHRAPSFDLQRSNAIISELETQLSARNFVPSPSAAASTTKISSVSQGIPAAVGLPLLRALSKAVFGAGNVARGHGEAAELAALTKQFFQAHLEVPGLSFVGMKAWRLPEERVTGMARACRGSAQQVIDDFFSTLNGTSGANSRSAGSVAAREFLSTAAIGR